MRLFVDTASIDEVRRAAAMGVVEGVTTNPSLMAKEGVEYRARVIEICETVDGPISAECVSTSADALVEEGRRIASWHPNVVVKVPVTEEGLGAISRLSADGIRINCTLIFSANQALLAARAGATFVSPFVGRLDDGGQDGMRESVSWRMRRRRPMTTPNGIACPHCGSWRRGGASPPGTRTWWCVARCR